MRRGRWSTEGGAGGAPWCCSYWFRGVAVQPVRVALDTDVCHESWSAASIANGVPWYCLYGFLPMVVWEVPRW